MTLMTYQAQLDIGLPMGKTYYTYRGSHEALPYAQHHFPTLHAGHACDQTIWETPGTLLMLRTLSKLPFRHAYKVIFV